MDCVVTISKVEFLEINPMLESELKLYFPFEEKEHYTLMPGSKKELCKLFGLQYNDSSDECRFENIQGKKCKVSKREDNYTFIECVEG